MPSSPEVELRSRWICALTLSWVGWVDYFVYLKTDHCRREQSELQSSWVHHFQDSRSNSGSVAEAFWFFASVPGRGHLAEGKKELFKHFGCSTDSPLMVWTLKL